MGKRSKSSRGPAKKQRQVLATAFKCVFCSHETGVTVKLDRKSNVGNLSCKSCGQTFQGPINNLSAPVDVYAEWIDACDALAHDTAAAAAAPSSFSRPTQSRLPTQNAARGGLAPGEKYDTEDGFIDDDDADGEADFNDDDD